MAHTENSKLIENEAKFREVNESVGASFDELEQQANERGWAGFVSLPDDPIFFYCECSDENCNQRLPIKLKAFNKIHEKRNRFIIIPGHEAVAVERVISVSKDYSIVEKFITPPEHVESLHKTDIDNSK